MAHSTVHQLVEFLGRQRVLDARQLDEVRRTLLGRCADPRALAKELLQRNWITGFQASQIAQGKAAQLVLGSYLLLDLLGEGGAGLVFKARHLVMNRIVALKILRKELAADKEVVARFFREIEVVSQIDHPNIVHAYDAGPVGAVMVLAMEYVDGISLENLVKKTGRLPVPQACDYIRQAALALQHVHERGLIHRDIKPSNLLVNRGATGADKRGSNTRSSGEFVLGAGPWGLVKLLDLGLARLQQPAEGSATKNLTVLAGSSVMQGTPDYMAPEQAIDFHNADIRSDIYSLGCTLYFLLAGHPVFPGTALHEKLLKHQTAPPPPIETIRKDVPPALADILRKMLAKKPDDRFQTPGEIGLALAPFVLPPRKSTIQVEKPSAASDDPSRKSDILSLTRSTMDLLLGPSPTAEHKLTPEERKQVKKRRKVLFASAVGGTFLLLMCLFGLVSFRGDASTSTSARNDPGGLNKAGTPTTTVDYRPRPKTSPGRAFDGKSEFVEEPHRPDLEPAELTITVWVYPHSLPTSGELRRWIVGKNIHEHTDGFYGLVLRGKKIGAYLNIGGGAGNVVEAWSSRDVLLLNQWQHLAMVYNGATLRVFYDGTEVALTVVSKNRTPGTGALTIGRRPDGFGPSYFHGKLDDIRVYNRTLPDADIGMLYLRPDADPPPTDRSLVFRKRF